MISSPAGSGTHGYSAATRPYRDAPIKDAAAALQLVIDSAVPADAIAWADMISGQHCTKADKARAVSGLVGSSLPFRALMAVGGEPVVDSLSAGTGMGKRALTAAVRDFQSRAKLQSGEPAPAWTRDLELSASGTPRPIRENVELCLRHDEELRGLLAFDEFATTVVFTREPPWADTYAASRGLKPGTWWSDEDDTRLAGYLAAKHKLLDVNPVKVRAALSVVAHDHRVHPVRVYLSSLKWDGQPRVGNWLTALLRRRG